MRVKTEKINDRDVDIEIDSNGTFYADVPEYGEQLRAKSLEELREKISKAVSKLKARVAVDVTLLDVVTVGRDWQNMNGIKQGVGYLDLVLRGVHPRTGSLMVTMPDGKKTQLEGYSLKQNVARRLTDEQKARYDRLSERLTLAKGEMEAFRKEVLIDPALATGGK